MHRCAIRSALATGVTLCALVWIGAATGCSRELAAAPSVGARAEALFQNGSFESDTPNTPPMSWTVNAYLNRRVTLQSPQTLAGLNLDPTGGDLATRVVGGTARESQSDPVAKDLHYPRYGLRSAVINYAPPINGNNTNANALKQQMTIGQDDVDPDDGQIHIRFALAPVLENPNHDVNEQPYYFVQVRNLTRNVLLYEDFQISNQPGVPWLDAGNATLYTNWQLVDVAPQPDALALGEVVEAEVVAAGCAFTAHFGRVYVDAFGGDFPGLFTTATAPATTSADADLTYTVRYKNGADTAATHVAVDFVTPPGTTFVSTDRSSGCTAPAPGATGTVTCDLGDLAGDANGTFQVTVHVAANATGKITQGNYAIRADGESPLLGSHVVTTIPNPAFVVNVSTVPTVIGWNSPITYTITVENVGTDPASGVRVRDVIPSQLRNATWQCSGTGGGTCSAAGSGNIDDTVDLPVGARVTYILDTRTIVGNSNDTIKQTATATYTLPNGNVITGTDTKTLELHVLNTVTLTKTAPGRVVASTVGLICNTGCTSTVGEFASGSNVTLRAVAPTGGRFEGWSGACSGTGLTCTFTPLASNVAVTATFRGPRSTLVSGTPQQTKVRTAFSVPLEVTVLDPDGAPVRGAVVQFRAPESGASAVLSGTDVTTGSTGRATITASANAVAGSYQVVATVRDSTDGVPFSLTNLGDATQLTVVTGAAQTVTVGEAAATPIVVRVSDESGAPLVGVPVRFTAPSSGAAATFTTSTVSSDDNGLVSTPFSANSVTGSYVISATVMDPAAGMASVEIDQTNTAGPPSAITLARDSSPQSALVSTDFARPLQVRVTDRFGNPVNNVRIRFTAPSGPATAELSAGDATTNDRGETSVTAKAGSLPGSYRITAELPDGTSAAFELTNTVGDSVTVTISDGGEQTTTPTMGFGDPIAIQVRDDQGRPVSGIRITVGVTDGTSTGTPSDTELVTDDDGRATVQVTAGPRPGTFTVEFKVEDGTTATTTVLHVTPIPTRIGLEVSRTSVEVGTPVTLTATVTSNQGAPPGRVRFSRGGDPIGEADLTDGRATFEYTSNEPGTQQITATYEARDAFGDSSSTPVPLEITAPPDTSANELDAGTTAEDTRGWKLAGGSGTCSAVRVSANAPHALLWLLSALAVLIRVRRRPRP